MAQKGTSQTEKILTTLDARLESLEQLSERVVAMEKLSEKQESRNQGVLYAVLFGAVFILITVAVEVIISNKDDASNQASFYQSISEVKDQVNNNATDLKILKAKNSYLK